MRTRPKSREAVLTSAEVALLVALIAKTDPEQWAHDSAKALVFKCRDLQANPPDHLWVRP